MNSSRSLGMGNPDTAIGTIDLPIGSIQSRGMILVPWRMPRIEPIAAPVVSVSSPQLTVAHRVLAKSSSPYSQPTMMKAMLRGDWNQPEAYFWRSSLASMTA
ncbi:MAG: hypothetical protein NTY19_39555 [Planctomycetota bacterium]|nr:hypothetical protein [Planctomycetota bacterium]